MIKFIQNIGEYFSSNYFDEDFSSKVLSKTGYTAEDIKEFNKRVSPLKDKFYRFKQSFIEGKLRTKDKIYESHQFHTLLLNALGYEGNRPQYNNLFHLSENEVIPVRHILHRGEQVHLMIMEMQALFKEDDTDPDGLFEQRYNVEDESQTNPPQKYHRTQWDKVFQVPTHLKISPVVINKAISELFLFEPHLRPKYILLLAGNIVYLLEQEKWFRGSYLVFDLEELFTEATANRNANFYALFYFLLGKESLTPESNMVLLDQLDEDSHKSAYEVTKDLKEGIIHAVEALANEALYFQKHVLQEVFDETDDTFEQEIKDDCLNIIYRLLFVFYAESREDLDILPSNDPIYNKGYSLEMLRDLEQVPLYSETSLNGYFFHESLSKLFDVLSNGYREKEDKLYYDSELKEGYRLKINKSFKVRHIDSPLFNNAKLHHLHKVKFRNKIWQDIICRLSLSKQQRTRTRGRISYANLGINQLGSVYESLLAYRGFYAEQDYIEVHKADAPNEGTYLVPRMRRDDFQENEILKDGTEHDVITKKGTFVYRLSGRDRQKSASYYTPEVLTRCTVKYTLKPILEKLDKAEMKAVELLELKLLEPAMGAAAFHNEMINQLAEAYISHRQKELNKRVPPDLFKEELQKVKAYIATNNTYGVDLNPTAIELGKLSLWLNVIHKDMETPFFSNRLAVGNAVVGAWLKVYKEKDLIEEDEIVKDAKGRDKRVPKKKEWWETAPRQLEFKPNKEYDKIKHGRKQDEIYHFLLPDKNMVPSAGIRMLKTEYDTESRGVSKWKKDFCEPLKKSEIEQLKKICNKVDELLAEFYRFQRTINAQTANKQEIFGITGARTLNLKSYDEKEQLADQRNRHNAPYFKLKMVMDYWCSLWFWDVREAKDLPTRQQYWQDIANILELDTNAALEGVVLKKGQQKLFDYSAQLSMVMEPNQLAIDSEQLTDESALFTDAVVEYANRNDLFDKVDRIRFVKQLADKYHYFHPQLEFLDVFWERGGFDLIAGNPPWLKVAFEEKGILSEKYPEIAIRSTSAPQIRNMQTSFFSDKKLKESYENELIETNCTASFMNGKHSYSTLIGQQTNLYKCILVNGFDLLGPNGWMGLIHPESVYEDSKGQALRKEIYARLKFHFHFKNIFKLFQEVHHRLDYGVNVYGKENAEIFFTSISNLLHPNQIEVFESTFNLSVDNAIIVNNTEEDWVWNLKGNVNRLINHNEKSLQLLADLFEKGESYKVVKLVNIQSNEVIQVLEKLSVTKERISDKNISYSEGFHETSSISGGELERKTIYPDLNNYELVLTGPMISVSYPLFKSPQIVSKEGSDYDFNDLQLNEDLALPRTNLIPSKSFPYESKEINSFRIGFRKMVDIDGERTLQPALLAPKMGHINSILSAFHKDFEVLASILSLTTSILYDFCIKTIGSPNIYGSRIDPLPYKIESKYKTQIFLRVLRLNCIQKCYTPFWEELYQKDFQKYTWSAAKPGLEDISNTTFKWTPSTPFRNLLTRRQALVEIDVLVAMNFGLSLDELIKIYLLNFSILKKFEDDTWYDINGKVVFTPSSKTLSGVGVDRPVWETIRNLKDGETYEHTITKSELYQGKKIIYTAPFDKCDRVEDYKVAWEHFEKVFKEK